jgi:hypothetical protein
MRGLPHAQAASLSGEPDFLWACPDHYRGYDPGLPVIPGDRPEAGTSPGFPASWGRAMEPVIRESLPGGP